MGSGVANVGVPDVPRGNLERMNFDRWTRNTLLDVQAALLQATVVSNLRATALAGAVQIDFTRSDGDAYVLYINSVPSINMATRVDLGTANLYVDQIGAGSILRYYGIVAMKGRVVGDLSPWVAQTTLALGVAITPPDPPPATETPFTDQETDSVAVQLPDGPDYRPL